MVLALFLAKHTYTLRVLRFREAHQGRSAVFLWTSEKRNPVQEEQAIGRDKSD